MEFITIYRKSVDRLCQTERGVRYDHGTIEEELTDRGLRQAVRNDSREIWKLFGTEVTLSEWGGRRELRKSAEINTDKSKEKSRGLDSTQIPSEVNISKKPIIEYQNVKSIQSHPTTHITTARPTIVSEVDTRSKAEHDQLKIRISQYLLEQKPYTRLVADSAFRLRYRKPCLQTYGSRNRSADKTCYGNDMKTHSVQPHTLTNKPKTYQTYTSALNFGKRMKIDQKDRWKRLERVLSKSVDFKGGVDQIATGYIEVDNSNEEKVLKRSIKEVAKTCGILYPKKEKGKVFEQHETGQKINLPNNVIYTKQKYLPNYLLAYDQKSRLIGTTVQAHFIYKMEYKMGANKYYSVTRYARDRHGLHCYVDPFFKENDYAERQFQLTIKPILPIACQSYDINIDSIREDNFKKSKNITQFSHYLLPNVEVLYVYNPMNYSRKRTSTLSETAAGML